MHSGNINCFGLQFYSLASWKSLFKWRRLFYVFKNAKMIAGDIGDFENLCGTVKDCGTFIMNDLVNISCLS